MNRKLKAIGLGLLVALAASILSVTGGGGASAETGGHFTSDSANNTKIKGEETGFAPHTTRFHANGHKFKCVTANYLGEVVGNTATEVLLTPEYIGCYWEKSETEFPAITVAHNGCKYKVTIRGVEPDKKHSTASIVCPVGKKIEIKYEMCKISIGTQTIKKGGVVYTTKKTNDKHTITADVTAEEIAYTRHEGLCIFLGTNAADGVLTGSVIVQGTDKDDNAVNITATGK